MTDINRQDLAKFYSIVPDMSILNPSLDWDMIKYSFEKKEHIVIESLLDQDVAVDIWKMYNDQPENFWDLVLYNVGDEKKLADSYYFDNAKEDVRRVEKIQKAKSLYDQNADSYLFYKSQNFHPFLSIFNLPEFKEKIAYVTGHRLEKLTKAMVSCYAKDHFCSPHLDHPSVKAAFIYHLSNNWPDGNSGGVFIKDDLIVPPQFNSLVLFNVTAKNSLHEVTKVITSESKRISFTGWYL